MLRIASMMVLVSMTGGCSLAGRGINWIHAQTQDRSLPERVVAANAESGGWLYDLQLSPDEKVIATAKWWGVEFHDAETLKRIRIANSDRFPGVMTMCDDLEWSPDGKLLACAVRKNWNNIVLYSYEEDRVVRVLRGHEQPCWKIAFSSDGKRLASIPDSRTEVRVWDVATGEMLWERAYPLEAGQLTPRSISLSSDGKWLAVGGRGGMELLRADDGAPVSRIEIGGPLKDNTFTTQMIFTRDGKRLLHIGAQAAHHWLTVPELERVDSLPIEQMRLTQTYDQYKYLEDRAVFIGADYSIYIFDLAKRSLLTRLNTLDEEVHTKSVNGIDVTRDRRFLYTADGMGLILKWRIDDLLPPEKKDEE